jgi:hypothetical protein
LTKLTQKSIFIFCIFTFLGERCFLTPTLFVGDAFGCFSS